MNRASGISRARYLKHCRRREAPPAVVTSHLRDMIPGYLTRREDLMAIATVIAAKRESKFPQEAQAARILLSRIRNERLG